MSHITNPYGLPSTVGQNQFKQPEVTILSDIIRQSNPKNLIFCRTNRYQFSGYSLTTFNWLVRVIFSNQKNPEGSEYNASVEYGAKNKNSASQLLPDYCWMDWHYASQVA